MTSLVRKTPADLERARSRVGWIDDDDLDDLESKSLPGATLLALFTWGGGRLYLRDIPRGAGLLVMLVAWLSVSSALPAALGPLVYWMVGGAAAWWTYRDARAINRLVATRSELALRQGPDPSAYRLLASAAAVNPALAGAVPQLPALAPSDAPPAGPHAEVVDRLRKIAALVRAGVLHPTEARARKIDVLEAAAPATTAALDELLFALLPLGKEGVLDAEDFELLKQLGGGR